MQGKIYLNQNIVIGKYVIMYVVVTDYSYLLHSLQVRSLQFTVAYLNVATNGEL